jgi:hypothetical protein
VKRLAFMLLAACGGVEIKPPNTAQACARAVECGALEDASACVACLEHVRPELLELADDLPSLDTLDCATLTLAVRTTNLPACVAERWYGP